MANDGDARVAEVYADSDSGEDFYGFSDQAGDSSSSSSSSSSESDSVAVSVSESESESDGVVVGGVRRRGRGRGRGRAVGAVGAVGAVVAEIDRHRAMALVTGFQYLTPLFLTAPR